MYVFPVKNYRPSKADHFLFNMASTDAVLTQILSQLQVLQVLLGADDVPLSRRHSRTQSHAASIHESLYSNRTSFLRKTMRRFGEGFGGKVKMKEEELKRIGSFQTKRAGQMLTRQPSGTGGSGAGEDQFTKIALNAIYIYLQEVIKYSKVQSGVMVTHRNRRKAVSQLVAAETPIKAWHCFILIGLKKSINFKFDKMLNKLKTGPVDR